MAVTSLLIYGGAFNPPHLGHMALLSSAVDTVKPQLTLVMPSKKSPHKREGDTGFFARYHMCRCFTAIPGVRRSAAELFMPGKSYTINTVERLKKRYPHAKFYLLIGTDMLVTFTEWREYERLLGLCTLVAGAREGDDDAEIAAAARRLEKLGGSVIILKNKPVEISSTAIRAELAQSGESRHLAPEVLSYIRRKGLYGTKD